jgi:hypothetical protein
MKLTKKLLKSLILESLNESIHPHPDEFSGLQQDELGEYTDLEFVEAFKELKNELVSEFSDAVDNLSREWTPENYRKLYTIKAKLGNIFGSPQSGREIKVKPLEV